MKEKIQERELRKAKNIGRCQMILKIIKGQAEYRKSIKNT